jgi:hypothetical protein
MTLVIEFGTVVASKEAPYEVKSATKDSLFQTFGEQLASLRTFVLPMTLNRGRVFQLPEVRRA